MRDEAVIGGALVDAPTINHSAIDDGDKESDKDWTLTMRAKMKTTHNRRPMRNDRAGRPGALQNRRLATARESALQGRHVRGGEAADARRRDVTYGDVAGDEVTAVDGVTERGLQSCERRELPRPDCLLLIASRNRFRLLFAHLCGEHASRPHPRPE